MRIVGVISSPHEDGSSATLVREALAEARREGAEVSEVCLPKYRIEFCRACDACLRTGRCPIQDDFERVKAELGEADGIILSTPTYGAAPSARLKNLMDRLGQLSFLTSFFGGKYLAGIATASSFGHKKAAGELAALAGAGVFQRTRLTGTLAVTLHGRHVRDVPKAMAAARRLGRKMVRDIATRTEYRLQNLPTRILNRLVLRPAMGKAITRLREEALPAVYAELVRKGLMVAGAASE